MVSGWLFDVYPQNGSMVCWIIQENGKAVKCIDSWTNSIYVASDSVDRLRSISDQGDILKDIKEQSIVSRYERLTDTKKSDVLKVVTKDCAKTNGLARKIEKLGSFGTFRLYNVDVSPPQLYFYENEIFPLAYCSVERRRNGKSLKWDVVNDDVWSTDYDLPCFQTVQLDVKFMKKGKIPVFSDPIESIVIKYQNQNYILKSQSEIDTLFDLQNIISRIDPDFIFTEGGDSFLLPYLAHRSEVNKIEIVMGRESAALTKPKKEGVTFISYGKTHYRPSTMKLYGRVHIDTMNSFILDEAGLQGLFEVSRICKMPLHMASRASIGRCMSSLQFYNATKRDILIPWKPTLFEHFKTFEQLLVADRGGMIFEPEVGVHEQVAEFDFASLYPNIMMKKNISAETIKCDCCTDSEFVVPEVGYNICQKKLGIVPLSLKILLEKRSRYKELKKSAKDPVLEGIYDARQNALKWILVTSFGYLGFNNARFGRIDAHISVCAFDRQLLMQTVRIAENEGFRVLHGIIDSLWLYRKDANENDYLWLKERIEKETGFEISFEGIYKWITFIHAKNDRNLPVGNRYFGVFKDGKIKVRGIEIRRHDTPKFFMQFQQEILKIMADGNTMDEVKKSLPAVINVFSRYVILLKERKVPLENLIFVKRISKDSDKYWINTIEKSALDQLKNEGKVLHAGQILRYVITDYYGDGGSPNRQRAVPVELINDKIRYDVKRYVKLLADTCNSIMEPFGGSVDLKNL